MVGILYGRHAFRKGGRAKGTLTPWRASIRRQLVKRKRKEATMDMGEQCDRIDQALRHAHWERTRDHQALMAVHQLRSADVALSALTAGAVFVWTMGAVSVALRLAGYG